MQKFRSQKSGGLKSEIVVRPSQIGRQIPSAYLYPCTTVMSRRAHAGARSGNSMVPLGSASSLLLAAIVLAGAPPAASSFSTTLPLHRCAPLPPSRCVGNSWRRNPSAQTPALAASTLVDQVAGAYDCASLALGPLFQPDASADVNEIVRLCDEIDVDPSDVLMLVFAWCLGASQMGYFSREEWLSAVGKVGDVTSEAELKERPGYLVVPVRNGVHESAVPKVREAVNVDRCADFGARVVERAVVERLDAVALRGDRRGCQESAT